MANILSPFQQTLMGMFQPAQAPANAGIMEQAQADARKQMLAKLGFGLMAAAIPQTAAQRAQALQQAFGGMGDMNTAVYNNAQARLMAQQIEASQRAAQEDADFNQKLISLGSGGTAPVAGTFQPPSLPGSMVDSSARRLMQPPPPSVTVPTAVQPQTVAQPTAQSNFNELGLTPEQTSVLNRLPPSQRREQYNKYIIENAKPEKSSADYLGMQTMKIGDKYYYVQPSKAGESPAILGEAPAPGEEEKAVVEAKAKGDIAAFQPKANRALIRTESNASNVVNAATEALRIIRESTFATGKTGKLTSNIPGTDAYNLSRLLDTVKANVGFNELQSMREASPTGGALGQVAVQELESLQATKGSLDIGQDAELLEKALLNIISDTDSTVQSMYDAYERDYGEGSVNRESLYDLSGVYNAPQDKIDILIQNADNPAARRAFDRQFGKGASKYYIGVD